MLLLFYSSNNLEKYIITVSTKILNCKTVFNIDNNKTITYFYWVAYQHIQWFLKNRVSLKTRVMAAKIIYPTRKQLLEILIIFDNITVLFYIMCSLGDIRNSVKYVWEDSLKVQQITKTLNWFATPWGSIMIVLKQGVNNDNIFILGKLIL